MLIASVVVVSLLSAGRAWWGSEAGVVADRVYKPPLLRVKQSGSKTLSLTIHDSRKPAETISLDGMVPDHGHLMHLFLVRVPALDAMFHLHPQRHGNSLIQQLPSLPRGRYEVFGDLVHSSGFPLTAIGEITLPDIQGLSPEGDDSSVIAGSIDRTSDTAAPATLSGGGRMVRLGHSTLIAGEPTWLQFRVEDESARPVTNLEPYMGMPAHLVVIRKDRTVFAHLHPSGSPPMATVELANGSSLVHHAGHTAISPELTFPYGFPQAGDYRLFVQIRRAGKVQTAIFDVKVAKPVKTARLQQTDAG